MDALGIDKAPPMIGNSMGGVVGVNLAIKKPDRVEKLVTIGGGVGPNVFSPQPPARACDSCRSSPTPRTRTNSSAG